MGGLNTHSPSLSPSPSLLPPSLSLQSQWKAGKRKAEKDDIIAGLFFSTVEHPEVHMEKDSAYVSHLTCDNHMTIMCSPASLVRVRWNTLVSSYRV